MPCDSLAIRTAVIQVAATREALAAPRPLLDIVVGQIAALLDQPVSVQAAGTLQIRLTVGSGYEALTVAISDRGVETSGRYASYATIDKINGAVKQAIEAAGPRLAGERLIGQMKATSKDVLEERRPTPGVALLTLRI